MEKEAANGVRTIANVDNSKNKTHVDSSSPRDSLRCIRIEMRCVTPILCQCMLFRFTCAYSEAFLLASLRSDISIGERQSPRSLDSRTINQIASTVNVC